MDSIQQQHILYGFAVDSHTNIEEASDDVPYEDDGTFDEAQLNVCEKFIEVELKLSTS